MREQILFAREMGFVRPLKCTPGVTFEHLKTGAFVYREDVEGESWTPGFSVEVHGKRLVYRHNGAYCFDRALEVALSLVGEIVCPYHEFTRLSKEGHVCSICGHVEGW